jgi:hypothetical protein
MIFGHCDSYFYSPRIVNLVLHKTLICLAMASTWTQRGFARVLRMKVGADDTAGQAAMLRKVIPMLCAVADVPLWKHRESSHGFTV